MARLNYSNREKRWGIYHKFEQEDKRRCLRKLSEDDGFRTLKELYQFAYKLGVKPSFKELDMAKIKTLADVHSMFGKVEA